MAFDGRYKLVMNGDSAPLLYDVEDDPWEDRNIASGRAKIVEELAKIIEAERDAAVRVQIMGSKAEALHGLRQSNGSV
jgi:arylsulfatase A-like enzyme